MLNKTLLIGNVGKDPEVKVLDSGSKVAQFSVATNENYKDKNGEWQTVTEWHNIVCWRQLADKAEHNIKKGGLVFIEGKSTTRTWEQDGEKKYRTEVVANYFRVINKSDNESEPAVSKPVESDPVNSGDDDLPF